MSLTKPSGKFPTPGAAAGKVFKVKSEIPKFGWPAAWVNHLGSEEISFVHCSGDWGRGARPTIGGSPTLGVSTFSLHVSACHLAIPNAPCAPGTANTAPRAITAAKTIKRLTIQLLLVYT